jgi:L-asparaginase
MGGTIASVGPTVFDQMDYPEYGTRLTTIEVLKRMPEVIALADFVPVDITSVASTAVTIADWLELRRILSEVAKSNFDGALVLHGTSTLEETAYFLSLTMATTLPVAIVGAQRPLGTVGSDAFMNVIQAVRALTSDGAAGAGIVVVMNDAVHAARDARKNANFRLDTFESGTAGILASVDGDGVHWFRNPRTRHTTTSEFSKLPADALAALVDVRVDMIYTHAGADAVHIEASLAAGAAGLVSVGAAPGIATPIQNEALVAAAAAGVVVVQSSRASRDRVPHRAVHSVHGFVAGDDLSPAKCRVLLLLALVAGIYDRDGLTRVFDTY